MLSGGTWWAACVQISMGAMNVSIRRADPATSHALATDAARTRDALMAASTKLRAASEWLFPNGEDARVRWPVEPYSHPNPHVGLIAKKTPASLSLIAAENTMFEAARAARTIFAPRAGSTMSKELSTRVDRVQAIGYGAESVADMRVLAAARPAQQIDVSRLTVERSVRGDLASIRRFVDSAASTFDAAAGAYLAQAHSS